MDFQKEISLKRFAMVAYVASFWKRPFIEDKIYKYICRDLENLPNEADFFRSLLHHLKEEIKATGIPLAISNELTDIIIQLLLATYNWYGNVCCIGLIFMPLKLNCRIPLYWTNYGRIDMAKTGKEWAVGLETVKETDEDKHRRLTFGVYFMACTSIHKIYINIHSQEMFNFCLENLDKRFVNRERDPEDKAEFKRKLNFIIHSVLFLSDLKVNTAEKYFPNSNCSKEAYMFQLAVKEMHKVPVQYYWNLLDSQEKEKELVPAAVDCAEENRHNSDRMNMYDRRYYYIGCLDTLIYLLRQMSMDQLEEFLNKTSEEQKIEVLCGMIEFWFAGDFFFSTFDVMKKHIYRHDRYSVKFFLQLMLDKCIIALRCDYKLGYDSKKSTCRRIFFTIWKELEENKWNRLRESDFVWDYVGIEGLYESFDIQILNLLMLDFEEDGRKEYFKLGKTYYKERIGKGQYDLIEKFMDVVLKSEEERTWFIENQLDFVADFKEKNNYEAVEKILEWQSSLRKNRMISENSEN